MPAVAAWYRPMIAAGVAHDVVVVGDLAVGPVVLVEPRAVGLLVAHEPLHGGVGESVERRRRSAAGSARAGRARRT